MPEKKAYIKVGKMLVEVIVIGHKSAYGHKDCVVVRPAKGEGESVFIQDKIISSNKVIIK